MIITNINLQPIIGCKIFSQLWESGKRPKGVIVLIHGLGEHIGRYSTHFADYYLKDGFSIITFDLPGHGKSGGKKGHINHYDDFNKLISEGISFAKNKYPNLPVFLYGHSLGGLIVLNYSIREKPEINGVIATAPVLDVYKPISPVKIALARIMNWIFPSFSLDSGLDRSMLSRDKDVIEKYNTDPLVHGYTSSRLGMFIIEKGEFVRMNAKNINVPTLVMVGSDDKIVSKKAIDDFCKQSEIINENIWPGFYHEIHNEAKNIDIFKFTSKWIMEHM